MGRPGKSCAIKCPALSVTLTPKGSLCTVTCSFAVLNPTDAPFDSGVTFALAVREEGSTAHEASSGSCPVGPTRTRTRSSRNAVICMTAAPERISIPFARARDEVTRSRRTNVGFGCAPELMVSCDAAATNRIPITTNEEHLALVTQHLMGARLMVVRKNPFPERNWETQVIAGSHN